MHHENHASPFTESGMTFVDNNCKIEVDLNSKVKQPKETGIFQNSLQNNFSLGNNTTNNPVNYQLESNLKQHISSFIQNNQKFSKDKSKKKIKAKTTTKTRAIKFHEYKGPPNAQKISSACTNKKVGETNYELIMQQQCLLEYLEGIYKYPNSIKNESDPIQENNSLLVDKSFDQFKSEAYTDESKKSSLLGTYFKSQKINPSEMEKPLLSLDKLNKMKVSELKSYLKKYKLPISGSKAILISRLKPLLISKQSDTQECIGNLQKENKVCSNNNINFEGENLKFNGDDLVKEQQKKIEELQRKLQESQIQLEQMKQSNKDQSFPTPLEDNLLTNKETLFKIIPNGDEIMYDSKYATQNQTTVYVVGVAPIKSSKESPECLPFIVHDNIKNNEIELSKTTSSNVDKNESSNLKGSLMNDDINDVLEILLMDEKWGIDDQKVKLDFKLEKKMDNVMGSKSLIDVEEESRHSSLAGMITSPGMH